MNLLNFALSVVGAVAAILLIAESHPEAIAQEPRPESDSTSSAPSLTLQQGRFVRPTTTSRTDDYIVSEEDAFSAVYRDADVRVVVNQIVGEFLGLDFTVSPDVTGTVTVRASNLRSRSEAITLLRAALTPIGIAVVERGDFILVTRSGEHDRTAGEAIVLAPGDNVPPGFGAVIITPRHILPSTLAPLISPLVSSSARITADDSRRALTVTGGEEVVEGAVRASALFDVDWFSQISTGIFPLAHVTPDEIVGELRPLLSVEAGNIELVALPRLSSLIVLARSPSSLQRASEWIGRLDRPAVRTAARGLLVYDVRHANAELLVSTVEPFLRSETQSGAQLGTGDAAPLRERPGSNDQTPFVITADVSQNSVIARGSDEQLAELSELLSALDRPRAQVLIEAAIVEVTLTDELRHGVNWAGLVDDRLSIIFSDASTGAVTSRFPGVSVSYVNPGIEAAINLLSSITHVEIVSRPSVIALHNETAELQIGDQVPITTQSAVSVTDPSAPIVNQTAYRDTGVILSVTPHVRSGGNVEVTVMQEVSDVSVTTTSNIDSPTISQRRISTRLLIPSGQAVALGGLISSSRVSGSTGVPVLRRIPVAGALFRSSLQSQERTELIVFITPRILTSPTEAVDATIALGAALERLQARLDEF